VRVYGPWSIYNTEGGPGDLLIPDMQYWKGDGIIGRLVSDEIAGKIVTAGLPAVFFNPPEKYLQPDHPLSQYSCTRSDSAGIGRMAAEFYLGRDYPNIAFVGEVNNISWSQWRQESFVARLAEAGKECHQYPLPAAKLSKWERERKILGKWLSGLPKPLSVFAANDDRARQVINACLMAGISVPHEVAVLGVNNDELTCETTIPKLSSIALDAERAGYEAARMLDEQMRGTVKGPQMFTYGPLGVIARESTETIHISDRLVIRALDFIRLNGGLIIRVSDVAEHLGVTRRWLEMRFRELLDRSVYDVIQDIRMATVCAMLEETDLSLASISKKCGFAYSSHLCAHFKQHFNMTMSDYRMAKQRQRG
jgi:LacI family transcriptional regulator